MRKDSTVGNGPADALIVECGSPFDLALHIRNSKAGCCTAYPANK